MDFKESLRKELDILYEEYEDNMSRIRDLLYNPDSDFLVKYQRTIELKRAIQNIEKDLQL